MCRKIKYTRPGGEDRSSRAWPYGGMGGILNVAPTTFTKICEMYKGEVQNPKQAPGDAEGKLLFVKH